MRSLLLQVAVLAATLSAITPGAGLAQGRCKSPGAPPAYTLSEEPTRLTAGDTDVPPSCFNPGATVGPGCSAADMAKVAKVNAAHATWVTAGEAYVTSVETWLTAGKTYLCCVEDLPHPSSCQKPPA
jgi:hypothetical protein